MSHSRYIGWSNREHWKSRLKRWGDQLGKSIKVITHRHERRKAKQMLAIQDEPLFPPQEARMGNGPA